MPVRRNSWLGCPAPKVANNRVPVREPLRTEEYVLPGKPVCSVLSPIINQIMTGIQFLVVGDDEPLVCGLAQVSLYPQEFV